jgi:hypothetical protein
MGQAWINPGPYWPYKHPDPIRVDRSPPRPDPRSALHNPAPPCIDLAQQFLEGLAPGAARRFATQERASGR